MANEAVLVVETARPIPFTIAGTATIEKGAYLVLSDPRTVATNTTSGSVVGGIAATEVIANSGVTQIGVYREGIFRGLVYGKDITVGQAVMLGTNNSIASCETNQENVLGTILETATGGSAETALFELRPVTMQLA